MAPLTLAFMGTPDFAVPVLDALIEAGHRIVRVYSQPARPAGRGKALRPSPVAARAGALGLPVETPERFRDAEDGFAALDLDAAVVVAYGQILRPGPLSVPRLGCLNVHASLLPRWRGAAPIQRALMAGDTQTGVCVMRMEAGLDTGPVHACATTPIGPQDTAGTLHDRLSAMGAKLMAETLPRIADGSAPARPQPQDGTTYAAKIDKAEARIDWSRPARDVDRHIRGLSPFPGAWCEADGTRVKLLLCETAGSNPAGAPPGTVLDDRLTIACGTGAVRIHRLQRAGKPAGDTADILRGWPVPAGTTLT